MKKSIRVILRLLLGILILIVVYLGVIIIAGTITDYRPKAMTTLDVSGGGIKGDISDSTFTFLSWNIGYCGLGADMDFFYDGGKMVRTSTESGK